MFPRYSDVFEEFSGVRGKKRRGKRGRYRGPGRVSRREGKVFGKEAFSRL